MILDKIFAAAAIAAGLTVAACSDAQTHAQTSTPQRLAVACTISTLCSLVSSVAGSAADVSGLVPVGASPETYEPTPSDVRSLSHATLLFENGEGLEAWLQNVVDAASRPDLHTVVLADGIPAAARTSGNPHLWMDPDYAALYVHEIGDAMREADPRHARYYLRNERREAMRLSQLQKWINVQIATVPADRRVMICFHDAWFYFDLRFGIRNIGAVEPSPGREPSPAYFSRLIALARSNHVRAVFAEPQFSPKLADALAAGAGIRTVENLYDDTLGTTPQLSDYDGMMRYDVSVIVKALRS